MRVTTCLWVLAFVFVALAAPPMEAAAKKSKRYGIEGLRPRLRRGEADRPREGHRDQGARPLRHRQPGGRQGAERHQARQGVRLRRRARGLDPAPHGDPRRDGHRPRPQRHPGGLQGGLRQDPERPPDTVSLEENSPDAVKKGAPKYKIMLVQIQMTLEELIRRWEKISVEE